jgi:hypothetical protein
MFMKLGICPVDGQVLGQRANRISIDRSRAKKIRAKAWIFFIQNKSNVKQSSSHRYL